MLDRPQQISDRGAVGSPCTLALPPTFVRNIHNSFGSDGKRFLARLPTLLSEAAYRWDLAIGEPFLLSYNYVCAATDSCGRDLVLKIAVPNPGANSEIDALLQYDGQGAVRLIDSDADKGLLLQERLYPGTTLAEVRDDQQATEIAADLMQALWRPVPEPNHFLRLKDWFEDLHILRHRSAGRPGPFPQKIVEYADALVTEFLAEYEAPVVLHADFHHHNVLRSRDTWVVIDPKGVIGPRGYEVGSLLINPLPHFLRDADARRRAERRVSILSERLGLERERVRGWAITHAVLSAWWDYTDNGHGGDYCIECATLFMSIPGQRRHSISTTGPPSESRLNRRSRVE